MSEYAKQGGAESSAVVRMASGAATGLKYFFSRLLHGFARRSPGEPALIFIGFLDNDRTDHSCVEGAAVLRAKQMERSHFRGLKPERCVTPRQNVLLDAERRNKKIVNHVLRSHRQLDRTAERHVQFVDLALPFRVLDLPHPLSAGDEDFHRALGRLRIPEIQRGTPYEDHRDDQSGDGGPKHFERERSLDRLGAIVRRATPIFDHEIENDRENQSRKKQRDGGQEKI